MIRGFEREEPMGDERLLAVRTDIFPTTAHKVVALIEHDVVVIGIEALDRPGLLLDISKCLSSLNLNLLHTEASVVGKRSISIWRCEHGATDILDLEAIRSVLDVSVCVAEVF